jgi:hypothetical protein
MLFGELAVALGMSRDDVKPYIEEILHIEHVDDDPVLAGM